MAYFDKYGVEYSDDRKTLVRCPEDFQGAYMIPEGVQKISKFAFYKCTGLTEITTPNSLIEIGSEAFKFCTSLKIACLYRLYEISDECFYGCKALELIFLFNTETIGRWAFYDCKSLRVLSLPDTVRSIQWCAFRESGLCVIIIPGRLIEFGSCVFLNCMDLGEIRVPKGERDRIIEMARANEEEIPDLGWFAGQGLESEIYGNQRSHLELIKKVLIEY